MNQQQIELNHQVNGFLQQSYLLEKRLEKTKPELASHIRRVSSLVAHRFIITHGLDIALSEFWKDKEVIAHDYV